MSATVVCAQCRSVVPQSETTFSNQGALLCNRCSNVYSAHMAVERARDAAAEQAAFGRSVLDVVNLVRVESQAGDLHSQIAAAGHSAPAPVAATVACARCRTVVPRQTTTLSLEGESLCPSCNATYDAAAERKRIEGSLFIGFLFGFFFSVAGIVIVYALNRKPAEKKGAVVGAGIAFVLFYVFVLPFLRVSSHHY
ncbi:MAG: hypothetical protein R3B70_33680 [Polyangiaceae bacterium]